MTTEAWLPIAGLEDYVEVSNHGNVRWRSSKEPLQSYAGNKLGHRRVYLGIGPKSRRDRYIHRLVLEAFIGPCPEGMEGCHNDGDASNNHLENLRWDTHSANMYDRVKHGNHPHTNRTHCPKGHPLDAVKFHGDGTFWQRRCRTCLREQNRAKKARKETCPQGHPFDGIAYHPDGSVRQRYCKRCRSESVSRQMTERNAKARAERTHCPHGHELDGLRKRPGGKMVPYCKTCLRESSRRNHAKKVDQTRPRDP